MFFVTKADGKKEPFNEQKVINSITRARIPQAIRPEVLKHVENKLYDGIPTAQIYKHILEFLDQSVHPFSKSRYSLKEAIMMLGPTGYPFEDFVAEILQFFGYKTKVRQILNGKCISHEIDVIAEKDGRRSIIEAKFHNNPGIKSEVHVSLYTYARFLDVNLKNQIDEAWIVTNTKTTIDANNFAECSGMKVLSWSYPAGESLRDLIEKSHLHPITVISSFSQSIKMTLLENHIVLCKDIYENNKLLDFLPLSKEEKEKALAEIKFICMEEELDTNTA